MGAQHRTARTEAATAEDGEGTGRSERPLAACHMDADRCSRIRRAHLSQVAQLIYKPQPSTVLAIGRGQQPTGQRLVDVAAVSYLAYEAFAIVPDLQGACPSAVSEAVRHDFVDGDDKI